MNDETKMKKKLAGKGYLFHTTYSMKIGKNNATGYRYEYDGVSGNRMWGEGVFFKVNSNGYRIYYSSTKKEVPTGTQDFDTFLNNIMVL